MALYSCKVINEVGKEERKVQEATDEKNLRVVLKEQNLTLMSYTKLKEKQPNLFLAVSSRVKPAEVTLFLRQFSVMINASMSISDALNALKQQNFTKPFKKVLMDIHNDVLSGLLLSEAIEKHLDIFPAFFVQMVAIGEVSGSLDKVLKSMADYYENDQRIKKKSQSAMTYPLILLGMIVVVIIFMSTVILPQFGSMFDSFGGEIPAFTQGVLSFGEFIRINLKYLIPGLIGIVLAIMLFFQTNAGKRVADYLKIHLPIIAKVNKAVITSRFTRAFVILLNSGMNITDCMENLKRVLGNEIYKERFQYAIDEVKRGKKIADAIEKTEIFPKMLIEMIAVGEKSGNLEETLSSTAMFFDLQVETAIAKATTLLEPVMILVLGVVVAVVLFSVYVPMIDVMNQIQ